MLPPSQTLTERVAGVLAARIGAGDYPLASKLPSGRLLAAEFGVSAAVIREATERLRAQGLIESRQGAGCVVRARTAQGGFRIPDAEGMDRPGLAAVYELRIELEGAAAALAARRRTPGQADELARILDRLERHIHDPDQGVRHDLAFHVAIAAATCNPHYQGLVAYLNGQMRQAVETARRNTAQHPDPAVAQAVQAEHRRIGEAIRAGDPHAARAAATAHLHAASRRLGLDLDAPQLHPRHSDPAEPGQNPSEPERA